ncbi:MULTISPECIES: hypothetical protein [Alphaproteobacteria]|uniref:hypothetical protein n=2 Tax=Pseudomonadota TaxID=1224 RepID=UPI003267A812
MIGEIADFFYTYSGAIGSIFLPLVATILAGIACLLSWASAKSARDQQLTNLRMSVQASYQEAQSSFSNLQIQCEQSKRAFIAERAALRPPLSRPGNSMFGSDEPHLKRLREIERNGAVLLQKAKENLSDLEVLGSAQLESRYAKNKAITAEIGALPMHLVGLAGYQ